ncbi:MAG: hypothetical protein V2A57_00560 [Elusimicrobiota bacterium]
MGCDCGCGKECTPEKKKVYKCECCGKTSETPKDCCKKPMKEVK